MKEYLLLFRGSEAHMGKMSPEELQANMQKWVAWMQQLNEQGKFAGAQPLINTGKVITGTKKVITDGPFMEGKEMVGGYLICKANNYDEAVEISMGCPISQSDDGVVEVREIQEMEM